MDGTEVVKLQFDPKQISYVELLRAAKSHDCARKVFALDDAQYVEAREAVTDDALRGQGDRFRVDKEPKYYLRHSAYRHVPMTELQAMRVNAHLGKQQAMPDGLLSPHQEQLLERVNERPGAEWPVLVGVEIMQAWAALAVSQR